MSNVPDKFYQVCRLCMAVVSDSDIPELSMYDISKTRSNQHSNNTVIISNTQKSDETTVSNHKNDIQHKLAADSKESIDCSNVAGLHNDGNGDGVGDDDDDDSRIDERIYTFLAITVSQGFFFL